MDRSEIDPCNKAFSRGFVAWLKNRYCEWALLRGPAFPSLREELRSNSTKQSSKKF
ncbi:hypothetical protein [Rickettsia felis]|uniref:hypothetical protein n=1 Tax=Rickettsia felis TaxID=42862 RepID=UPI0002D4547F|nr:hypothetical protein [Rickettsia felis]